MDTHLKRFTNTFEVFAGITTRVDYTVSGADYTPSVGVMTMSIGTHDLTVGQSIKFRDGSLGFTCTMDQNTAIKYYPRSKDPTYNTVVPITGAAWNNNYSQRWCLNYSKIQY